MQSAPQGQRRAPMHVSGEAQSSSLQHPPGGGQSTHVPSIPEAQVAPSHRDGRPVELAHVLSSKQQVPEGARPHDAGHSPSERMLMPAP
jgi:hypothetical protein